jgi:hypothetical protein
MNRSRVGIEHAGPYTANDILRLLDAATGLLLKARGSNRTWLALDFKIGDSSIPLAGHSSSWILIRGAGQVRASKGRYSKSFQELERQIEAQPRIFTGSEEPEDPRAGDH